MKKNLNAAIVRKIDGQLKTLAAGLEAHRKANNAHPQDWGKELTHLSEILEEADAVVGMLRGK